MNPPDIIEGLAPYAERFDLYLVDLWGVVHNGVQAHAAAVDCMQRLRQAGATVILISNAPRPSDAVAEQVRKLGVPTDSYDALITSGDAAVYALAERQDDAHKALARRYYHLGPEQRSAPLLAAIADEAAAFEAAGYLLTTGVVDDNNETAEQYREFLAQGVARGLPMLCVNPDRYVMRGAAVLPCAGALADIYEELGGQVIWYGKPGALVFEMAFARARELRVETTLPLQRAVMIGDGLKTDILGANRYGIASILVADGLLALEHPLIQDAEINLTCLQELCQQERAVPDMTMLRFGW